MVLIGWAILLLLLNLCVLFGVIGSKKALGKKICSFAFIFVALFGTAILLKAGVFDFAGKLLTNLFIKGDMEFLKPLTSSAINFVIRLVIFDVLFLIFYFLLKLIGFIVIKAAKLERFKLFQPTHGTVTTLSSGVLSGATVWFMCIFVCLPFTSLLMAVNPAVDKAADEDYSDTYAYEVATTIHEDYSFLTHKSPLYQAGKFTGANFMSETVVNMLGDVSFQNEAGEKVQYNVHDLFTDIVSSGVDGVILYERWVSEAATYGDLSSAADLLENVGSSPVVANTLCELLKNNASLLQGEDGETNIFGELLAGYTTENGAENFSNDVKVFGKILTLFFEKNAEKPLNSDKLAGEIIDFVTDESYADSFATELTKLTAFDKAAFTASEYCVELLSEVLQIKNDQSEAHQAFTTALLEQLNNRSVGEVNFENLEGFIEYLYNNDTSVEEYRTTHYDAENSENDPAYINYERYVTWFKNVNAPFSSYYLDSFTDGLYFASSAGTVYAYDTQTDKWQPVETATQGSLKSSYLLSQYLISQANGLIAEGEITAEQVAQYATAFTAENITANYSGVSQTFAQYTQALALKISAAEHFDTQLIYREKILQALHASESVDKNEDNKALAKIFKAGGKVYNIIAEADGNTAEVLLADFGEVGKILDAFSAYSLTKDVPEILLTAIAQQEAFAKYFRYESVIEITENVKNGTSTYEELFISIQSLYNIANEII